jgi:hypothetical protein
MNQLERSNRGQLVKDVLIDRCQLCGALQQLAGILVGLEASQEHSRPVEGFQRSGVDGDRFAVGIQGAGILPSIFENFPGLDVDPRVGWRELGGPQKYVDGTVELSSSPGNSART